VSTLVGVVAMAKDKGSDDEPPKSEERPAIKRAPSFFTIIALARALRVSLDELLKGGLRLHPTDCDPHQPFEAASPEVQEATLMILRAVAKHRRS
jgi:hypothetical protein